MRGRGKGVFKFPFSSVAKKTRKAMRALFVLSTKQYSAPRLVPSRYLCVLGGERRLGVRLRRARGLMGRDAIFPSSLPITPRARLNLTPNLLSPPKHINCNWLLVCSAPLIVPGYAFVRPDDLTKL